MSSAARFQYLARTRPELEILRWALLDILGTTIAGLSRMREVDLS